MPSDFAVTDEMRRWAREAGFTRDLGALVAKFMVHAEEKMLTDLTDFDLTFKKFVLTAVQHLDEWYPARVDNSWMTRTAHSSEFPVQEVAYPRETYRRPSWDP